MTVVSISAKEVSLEMGIGAFRGCRFLSPWRSGGGCPQPSKQVVTCFLEKNGKILALRRGRRDAQFALWGIPGGKLDGSESALEGLQREIHEETGVMLRSDSFVFLASAISRTATDGEYGLHLYYAKWPEQAEPTINTSEHTEYQWVDFSRFLEMDLLHAQKEAALLVKDSLESILNLKNGQYDKRSTV